MRWTLFRNAEDLKKDAGNPAYRAEWEEIYNNAVWWRDNFSDDTDRTSGWGHDYVCPKCAAQLAFDRELPNRHVCPACGTPADNSPAVLNAWVYYYRMAASHGLQDAAVAAGVLDDAGLRKFVVDTVTWYAENYVVFREKLQQPNGGIMMWQALDESVWGHNLLRALQLIKFDPQSAEGQRLYRLLFLAAIQAVMTQATFIHNIPLWHASFSASAALYFGDTKTYNHVMNGPFGVRKQVAEGFSEDGVWFENSTTYHYYALEAATRFCAFLKEAGRDAEEPETTGRVRDAYMTFLRIMFKDGIFPCINDGWKLMNGISDMGALYYMGAAIFPEVGKHPAMSLLKGARGLNALEWLYGKPEPSGSPESFESAHLPHNCMAILRAKNIEVFTKYGNLSPSHSHPDALEISISPFALDPGTTGYGSGFSRNWYRSTAAHSTFAIDGQNQRYTARGAAEYKQDEIIMTVPDAYDGVTATRRLKIVNNALTDILTCKCESPRRMDWFFHGAGGFKVTGYTAPAALGDRENGYQYFENVRLADGGEFAWSADGKELVLSFDKLPGGARIYICESPDNPGINIRNTVIVRAEGVDMTVAAHFCING